MTRHGIAIAALVAAGAGSAHADGARAKIDPATIAIDDTGAATQVIPVTTDAGWTLVGAIVRSVAAGDRYDRSLVGAFQIGAVTRGNFELTPARDQLRKPGNYRVLIDLVSHQGSNEQVDSAALIATVPAAKLDAPAAAVVEIRYLPWIHDWVDAKPIRLHAGAQRALSGLSVYASPGARDGKPADGVLAVAAGSGRLDVNASADAVVTATGFEPGTTTGTLEISARELDAPLHATYTVTRRMCGFVVALLFFAGGVIGWLVRVRAADVQRHATLCGEADKRRDALRDLAARVVADDQRPLQDAIANLTRAATSESDDELAKQIASADDAIKTATAALAASIATLKTQLAALVALESAGELTPGLAAARGMLAAHVAAAAAALRANRAADAARAITDVEQALVAAARADGSQLRSRKLAFDQLAGALAHAPAGLDQDWRPALGAAEQAITALASATDADIAAAIRALSDQLVAVRSGIELGRSRLGAFARDASRGLGAKELASVINRAATFTFDDDLEVAVQQLVHAIDAIYTAIETTAALLGKPAEGVAALLKQRDLLGAVGVLAPLLGAALGGEPVPPPQELPAPAGRAGFALRSASALEVVTSELQPPLLDSRALRRSWRAKAVQVAFSYGILPLIAWVTYGPAFVGTAAECLVLFGVGFSANFSIDAVVGAFDKLKKPA